MQVEGEKGINNLEKIFSVKNIDIIFIGPYDLSQSLGIPGEVDHPKMTKLMHDISKLAKENDVRLGTFSDSIPMAKKLMEYGFEYLAYSVDVNILFNSCKDIKSKILNYI
ncbi:aldolase/citrate lyase family protein [Gillisia marina]|uniref:aldolase/citrate lyase family protein n=1 Tax=Gillisia marina TaxID=1167637 RepID=UPI00192C3158|nr:aldolase/citrate lyase family protein [Gillisia marina]